MRAVAPIGTLFHPPEVPVVHLSPGSPDYRRIVGEMMYRFSLYTSRKERLAEFLAEERAPTSQPGGAVAAKSIPADKYLGEDTHRVENELDHAKAGYGRACAWAWPYVNLRPMCHQQGFEAATILNPFIPVPTIRLSEASPDYKETVKTMNYWEPEIPHAKARLTDLHDDRNSAVAAAKGKPFDEKVALKDGRLAKMFDIYQQMKPAMRQWRTDQYEVEMLVEPWYLAKGILAALQIASPTNPAGNRLARATGTRTPGRTKCKFNSRPKTYNNNWPHSSRRSPRLSPNWLGSKSESDSFGKSNRLSLRKRMTRRGRGFLFATCVADLAPSRITTRVPMFDRWIAEEPRLWQSYLARGAARLHTGQVRLAFADLKRVEQ